MSLLLWVHKVYQEFPNGRVVQGIYSMYEWTRGVIYTVLSSKVSNLYFLKTN